MPIPRELGEVLLSKSTIFHLPEAQGVFYSKKYPVSRIISEIKAIKKKTHLVILSRLLTAGDGGSSPSPLSEDQDMSLYSRLLFFK